MKRVVKALAVAVRWLGSAVLAYALWTLWLALVALAVVQVYIAATNELAVPDFLLRHLEGRLDKAGLHATFEGATFDPTGRVLVESPKIFMPGFADPIVTARAAYVGISPWALAIGRVDVREIRLVDGFVAVPAMLSPSGKAEPIVQAIDADILPGDRQIVIRHVTARVSGLLVSASGSIWRGPTGEGKPGELAATLRTRFTEFCRQAVDFTSRLDRLDQPSLTLELEAVNGRGAMVTAEVAARGLRLDAPVAVHVGRFHARTQFPLLGELPARSQLTLTAEDARLPGEVELHDVSAVLYGRAQPGKLRIEPVQIDLAVGSVRTPDGTAESVSGTGLPRSLTDWQVSASARVLDSEIGTNVAVDLKAKTARVDFAGSIASRVLDAISTRTHANVRKHFDFRRLQCESGHAEFGPGWKFERLTVNVALEGIFAHGVTMDAGRARIELDPQHAFAPEASARIGANYATGSYEHHFRTNEFRFLLEGRLRPLDISGWFHEWWPHFFGRFEFPVAPPAASVDVHGFWKEGRRTSVFVFADAPSPVILGQKLQRVRTRLFIRPGFYDGLELFGVDAAPAGEVRATFTVVTNVGTGNWRSIDVDGTSTLALEVAKAMAGEWAESLLSPFALATGPTVTAHGHFDGPDVASGHRTLDLDAHSRGTFKLHGFPLEDVAFKARLRDEELTIDTTQVRFAGGSARVHAKVSGPPRQRRLAFEGRISDASLGQAVSAIQNLAAARKGLPPPPPGKFVQEKANVLMEIDASGEGMYGDLMSFHGSGNASLSGPEIGEVPLFGPLSELLKFTALRLTSARAKFKLNGPKLEFPEVALRGANSAVDAHGDYALDRRQLDFRAKVFPFGESGSVIKSVVGAVLSPISNVLEVKLTGTLEKPDWAFVIGPTNLIRSLAPESDPGTGAPGSPPVAPKESDAKSAPAPSSPPAPKPN